MNIYEKMLKDLVAILPECSATITNLEEYKEAKKIVSYKKYQFVLNSIYGQYTLYLAHNELYTKDYLDYLVSCVCTEVAFDLVRSTEATYFIAVTGSKVSGLLKEIKEKLISKFSFVEIPVSSCDVKYSLVDYDVFDRSETSYFKRFNDLINVDLVCQIVEDSYLYNNLPSYIEGFEKGLAYKINETINYKLY